ncbi:MAG: hypothetical protein KDD33_11005 [Bdellovibrionales bacterium]|nr:hypothetical protein [Bdellovibrionales bacterium]
MKILVMFMALTFGAISHAQLPAPTVHQIPGLPGAELEIRFTNPQCEEHFYDSDVYSNSGELLKSKPKGVYCAGKSDFTSAFDWGHSPRMKLLEWIQSPQTKEILFVYQSVSDSALLGAICEAIKARGVKVTFVMSRDRVEEEGVWDPLIDMNKTPVVETERTQRKFERVLTKLTRCGLGKGDPQPVGILRGHTGVKESDSIGWAHNKYFIVNPNDPDQMSFSSGSGNFTTGAVSTNHENWFFFTHVPQDSHLARSLQCTISAQLDDSAHVSRSIYEKRIQDCLAAIPKELKKAEGIRSYMVPAQGDVAIKETIVPYFSHSKKITVAAHLLGYPDLFVRGMSCAAQTNPSSKYCQSRRGQVPGFLADIGGAEVRLLMDDDIHWLMVGQVGDKGKVGYNDSWEASLAERAQKSGVDLRFMQTNHHQGFGAQIHHSKILLFEGGSQEGVWTGAGNLTENAMHSNFENYYFFQIPSVVEAYSQQLDKMFIEQATQAMDMPKLDRPASESVL